MLITILKVLLILLILVSVAATLFNLPGHWVIFIILLIYSAIEGFVTFTVLELIFILCGVIVISLLDNVGMVLGAKKFGSTKSGILGAILGGVIGLLLGSLLGLFVGSFIGATLFEIVFADKDYRIAIKSGFGTTLGIFLSIIIKFVALSGISIWVISRII